MNRNIALAVVCFWGILMLSAVVVHCYLWWQESLQVADAKAAFDPIAPLGVEVISVPAGKRYCVYNVFFPEASSLSDATIAQIVSLSKLPNEADLLLHLQTRSVTDASIDTLISLETVDYLDVTTTSISDGGIARIAVAMPGTKVVRRSFEWRE